MSKPIKIEQSIGPHYFQSLYMENTVSSTAIAANNTYINPSTAIYNANNKLMANKYNSTGDFYIDGGHGKPQTNYLQVVTEGYVVFYTKISIDGVNWATATPTGISGAPTGGSTALPVNIILPICGTPAGLGYKISVTDVSGLYYINLLT